MGKNFRTIPPLLKILSILLCLTFSTLTILLDDLSHVYGQEDAVEMRISIILVKTKSIAQKIMKKLDDGGDFAAIARQYSTGPGKEEGGDLGYFTQEDMMEELKSIAMNLKIGEYSRLVETGEGYFILMKTDEKSSSEVIADAAQKKLWYELKVKSERLYQDGRYPEAIKVSERALILAEKAFGPDHPNYAASLNNLAGIYKTQGKYAEAEPLIERSLKIMEKTVGPDHPNVATSMNNLAFLYQAQGKFVEAEPLYKQSLKIRESVLKPDHPDVAQSLNNLVGLYRAQGEFDKAEPLIKRLIKIRERALGISHPDVAMLLENLAEFYRNTGKIEEAEKLEERVKIIRSNP